jgi:alpha/beta superfamily hydrolase
VPRKIESLFIHGPVGQIEALLEEPEEAAPVEVCLVCHPHPLYGGTMYNKVVHRTAKGLRLAGGAVLRFNFRGVGKSAGVHDNGPGEVEDARVCLNYLRERFPNLPYSIAGFSFGSRVALKLGCSLPAPKPARLIAIGFPTSRGYLDYLESCGLPKYFVQSTHDEHGPRPELEAVFAKFAEPKRLHFIEARDHFFAGALDELESVVRNLAVS